MEILELVIDVIIHLAAGWQIGTWLCQFLGWLYFKIRGDKQMEILVNIFFIGIGLNWLIRQAVATYVDVKMKLRELDTNGDQELKH